MIEKLKRTNQTPSEFREWFIDVLDADVEKAFKKNDILLHLTYQPDTLILDPNIIRKKTKRLFKDIQYVEVIERTYVTNPRYDYSDYVDGYHSHLIVREDDYLKIKGKLKKLDIVDKVVYDLRNLIRNYLSKQAGLKMWEKPTIHKPSIVVKKINTATEQIAETINVIVETINKVIKPAPLKAMTWVASVISKFILPDWELNFNKHLLKRIVNDT